MTGQEKFESKQRSRPWAELDPKIQAAWDNLAAEETRKLKIEEENAK